MGEAKRRAEAGEMPEKDGLSKAEREAIEEFLRQPVAPHPVRVTWKFLRMRDSETREVRIVVVKETPLGPMHFFYSPEDFANFLGQGNLVLEALKEEETGLHVIGGKGIVVPGADTSL